MAVLAVLGASAATAGTYTEFAPFDAGSPTIAFGINNAGFITGSVNRPDGSVLGFIRDPSGTYSTFSALGFPVTQPRGINDLGEVVGETADQGFNAYEFATRPGNGVDLLQNPNTSQYLAYTAQGVNNNGDISGDYVSNGCARSICGFTLSGAGDFTSFSIDKYTEARGNNDAGLVVGFTTNRLPSHEQGFIYDHGAATLVNDPNAGGLNTILEDINNNGIAVGFWQTADFHRNPFIYDSNTGQFTELRRGLSAFGINDLGQVVLTNSRLRNYIYDPRGAAVPEPSAWISMLLGFAIIGGLGRRRRVAAQAGV